MLTIVPPCDLIHVLYWRSSNLLQNFCLMIEVNGAYGSEGRDVENFGLSALLL